MGRNNINLFTKSLNFYVNCCIKFLILTFVLFSLIFLNLNTAEASWWSSYSKSSSTSKSTSFIQKAVNVVQSVVSVAKRVVQSVVNVVTSVVKSVVNVAKSVVQTVAKVVTSVVTKVVQSTVNTAKNVTQSVVNFVKSVSKSAIISSSKVEPSKVQFKTTETTKQSSVQSKSAESTKQTLTQSKSTVQQSSTYNNSSTNASTQNQTSNKQNSSYSSASSSFSDSFKKNTPNKQSWAPYFDPRYPWAERIYVRKEKEVFEDILISNQLFNKDLKDEFIYIRDTLNDFDRSILIKKLQIFDSQEIKYLEDFVSSYKWVNQKNKEVLFNFLKSPSVKAYIGRNSIAGGKLITYFYDRNTKLLVLIDKEDGKFLKSFKNIDSQIKITKKSSLYVK